MLQKYKMAKKRWKKQNEEKEGEEEKHTLWEHKQIHIFLRWIGDKLMCYQELSIK